MSRRVLETQSADRFERARLQAEPLSTLKLSFRVVRSRACAVRTARNCFPDFFRSLWKPCPFKAQCLLRHAWKTFLAAAYGSFSSRVDLCNAVPSNGITGSAVLRWVDLRTTSLGGISTFSLDNLVHCVKKGSALHFW